MTAVVELLMRWIEAAGIGIVPIGVIAAGSEVPHADEGWLNFHGPAACGRGDSPGRAKFPFSLRGCRLSAAGLAAIPSSNQTRTEPLPLPADITYPRTR